MPRSAADIIAQGQRSWVTRGRLILMLEYKLNHMIFFHACHHFYVSNSTQHTFPVIPYFSASDWNSWKIQRFLIGNIYDGVIRCQVLQILMNTCTPKTWSDFLMLHISEQFNKEEDSRAVDLELIAFAVRDYFQTVPISYTYLWKKENHDSFEIRIERFKKEKDRMICWSISAWD